MATVYVPDSAWHQAIVDLEHLVGDYSKRGLVEEVLANAGIAPEIAREHIEAQA